MFGRFSEANNKLRAQCDGLSVNCGCKFFQCYEKVSKFEREHAIKQFNLMGDWKEQSSCLTIVKSPVALYQKRRSRIENANS